MPDKRDVATRDLDRMSMAEALHALGDQVRALSAERAGAVLDQVRPLVQALRSALDAAK